MWVTDVLLPEAVNGGVTARVIILFVSKHIGKVIHLHINFSSTQLNLEMYIFAYKMPAELLYQSGTTALQIFIE